MEGPSLKGFLKGLLGMDKPQPAPGSPTYRRPDFYPSGSLTGGRPPCAQTPIRSLSQAPEGPDSPPGHVGIYPGHGPLSLGQGGGHPRPDGPGPGPAQKHPRLQPKPAFKDLPGGKEIPVS